MSALGRSFHKLWVASHLAAVLETMRIADLGLWYIGRQVARDLHCRVLLDDTAGLVLG